MHLRVIFGLSLFVLGLVMPAMGQAREAKGIIAKPTSKAADSQYKRVHQGALTLLLEQKVDEAVAAMTAHAQKHPQDPETQFMLALAYAQKGDVDATGAAIHQALKNGLPAERFLAGPRSLTDRLVQNPAYPQVIAELREDGLLHGPMVGDVTPASAQIWLRTRQAEAVVLRVSKRGEAVPERGIEVKAQTRDEDDRAIAMRVEGLQPDTKYVYSIWTASQKKWNDTDMGFRTAPAKATKFTIAFGGGSGFVPENERAWTTIAGFKPRALLLLGDNTYSDDPLSTPMQRYCYYRRQSRPEFRALTAHTPTYAIWDDHDFATNDSWGGPAIDEPAWKPEVWKVFTQNWPNPAFGGGPQRPGCWYRFSIGDVEFFMLDGRYYRTNPKQPAPSMLGPEQKKWLLDGLAASTATFKCLVSPVPWDFRTKGGSLDTWNGYQDEREAIFSFIEDQKIEGVMLISADRHRSDAWKIDRPKGYALYEFNSSRLTNQHVHETMKEAVFSYNAKQSFGLVEFDTTAADPTVTYTIVSIDGERVHTLPLAKSMMTFKKH